MTLLLTGARIAPCDPGIEILDDADSIAVQDGSVTFVGMRHEAPDADEVVDLGGRLVTPGLIDAHTHLVWHGDRLGDFLRRTGGASYAEMQREGGGILSTVAATASASGAQLVRSAARRLRWLSASGVTTAEVKSGYGMDTEAELRMLDAATEAGRVADVRVEPTLLGAHALPADRAREEQIDAVATEMIPAVAARGSATAVDVFADSIAFDTAEMERVFTAAEAHGLPVKAHVGQIADIGAAQVAARFGAISIDHCERVPEAAMGPLREAGSVAVLVPGASMYLGERAVPPVESFRRHGVRMAVASDLNPGSSPLASLPTAAALAIHRFGLTPEEALLGITSLAARALRLDDGRGTIRPGGLADLAIWDVDDPIEIVYWITAPVCAGVVVGGRMREHEPW